MNKKAFTLIEVLGVVIIMTSIALLILPKLINRFSDKKEDINNTNKELIISAAKLYVSENKEEIILTENIHYCLEINELIDNDYLDNKVINTSTNQNIVNKYVVDISVDKELNNNLKYDVVKKEQCN